MKSVLLRKYWGHSSFRPLQAEIIDSILSGADTLALLPTGGGKSITFQIPALILPGLTIVITPLISLMKDQVDNLRQIGIPAAYLHSGLTRAESRLAFAKAELGKIKLLYISPERLSAPSFRDQLKNLSVSLIVVDEAHCISQWGYDFRPAYLNIADLRALLPSVPVMALTASATPGVIDDITSLLRFRPGFAIFRKSFARQNISYIVRLTENKPERLLQVLRNTRGPAIVYVRSRKRTREIAQTLIDEGISADFYHAGLAPEDKDHKQQQWKEDHTRVIVATNAFGMGIDKPDVRTVIHYDIPSSVEEYYQEAGRAGRDGLPSFAVTIASVRDKAVLSRRLSEAFPPPEYIADVYEKACLFIDLSLGEGYNQTFDFDFNRFVITYRLHEQTARSALRILSLAGYVDFVEDVDARARLMILAPKHQLYDLTLTPDEDAVLQHILRHCSGVFADYVQISETVIASHLLLTPQRVYLALLGLNRAHVLHYVPRRQQPYLYFPSRRIQTRHVELPRLVYDLRRDRMKERLDAMARLVFDSDSCRANTILAYFGEKPDSPCGTCDVCRRNNKKPSTANDSEPLTRLILDLIAAAGPQGIEPQDLIRRSGNNPAKVTEIIRNLLDLRSITLNNLQNRLTICNPH